MIQFWFLSIAYIVFSALFILVDIYRRQLSFMLKAKSRIREEEKKLNLYFLAGIVIAAGTAILPMRPGPAILGDALPSALCLFLAFFMRLFYSEKNRERASQYLTGNKQKMRRLGFACLAAALLHFLFPSFVLL